MLFVSCLTVVLVAFAAMSSEAKNLKGSHANDSKLGRAKKSMNDAVKFLQKSSLFSAQNANKFISKHNQARKEAHSNNVKTVQGTEVNLEDLVVDGYAIERVRPNAECSGPVRHMLAQRMGKCFSDEPGTSYYMACDDTSEGWVKQHQVIFLDNENCEGQYQGIYPIEDLKTPQCVNMGAWDIERLEEEGYMMSGFQCHRGTDLSQYPGYTVRVHDNENCENDPSFVYIVREKGCHFDTSMGNDDDEDDEEDFLEYYRLTCNNEKQMFYYTPYADPECDTKRLGSSETFPFEDVEEVNNCYSEGPGEWYYSSCIDGRSLP